jgi:hypothetical protein
LQNKQAARHETHEDYRVRPSNTQSSEAQSKKRRNVAKHLLFSHVTSVLFCTVMATGGKIAQAMLMGEPILAPFQ